MNNSKEIILSSFKKGFSIDSIARTEYYAKQEQEKQKKTADKTYVKQKIDYKDVRLEVETVIYEGYMQNIKAG